MRLRSAAFTSLLFACTPQAQGAHEKSVQAELATARTIHPQPGSSDCIEMYGSCTPPPDPLCTSNAFVLACGESGQLPSSGERIVCACP